MNKLGKEFPQESTGLTQILVNRLEAAERNPQTPDSEKTPVKVKEYIQNYFPDLIASIGQVRLSLKKSEGFKQAVAEKDFGSMSAEAGKLAETEGGSFNGTYLSGIARVAGNFPGKGLKLDLREFWEYLNEIIL